MGFRILPLLCLLAVLRAVEIDPGLFRSSGSWDVYGTPAAGEVQESWSRLYGGVEFAYEAVVLRAESIRYRLRGLPTGGQAVIEALSMRPPADGAVSIDSRASRLPGLPARLQVRASAIDIERQEQSAQHLDYRLTMAPISPVRGAVLVDERWSPVNMRTASLTLDLRIGLDHGRLVDPGLTALDLQGDDEKVDLAIDLADGDLRCWALRLRAACDPHHGLEEISMIGAGRIERHLVDQQGTSLLALEASRELVAPVLHEARAQAAGSARGAVAVEAFGARLHGESIDWTLQRGEDGRTRVAAFELQPATDGRLKIAGDGGRLPIALHLEPERIHGRLLSVDAQGRGLYEVTIEGAGPFTGRLRQDEEWLPFNGRATRIITRFRAGIDTDGLGLVLLRLEGDEGGAQLTVQDGDWPGRFTASHMQLSGDGRGPPNRFESSADTVFEGLGRP